MGLHSRLGRETVHEIKYSTDGNELERLCKRDISRYQESDIRKSGLA
jgi:hypothetical protein